MKLKNIRFKNDSLTFRDEVLKFDDEGIIEVNEDIGQALLSLPFFINVDDTSESKEDSEPTEDSENNVVDLEFQGIDLQDEETLEEEEKGVEIDLNSYSVDELKDMLKEKEIDYPSRAKKAELIKLLSE